MQVQNNTNVNFCGKREILYNLGKALEAAQDAIKHAPEIETSLNARDLYMVHAGQVRSHIDSAVEDSDFVSFMDTFKSVITKKTETELGQKTLPEIVNNPKCTALQKILGFEMFKSEFACMLAGFKMKPNVDYPTQTLVSHNACELYGALAPNATIAEADRAEASTVIGIIRKLPIMNYFV